MKTTRLLEAFSEINDRHIRDAWVFRKKRLWRRIFPAAACLIVIVGLIFILSRPSQEPSLSEPSLSNDLPMLQINFKVGGMGFEGYMAYHIDELVNENPWREDMALSTLPVYHGPGHWASNGRPTDIDMEAMQAWALEIAGRLGFSETDVTVTDDRPSQEDIAAITEKHASIGEEIPDGFFEPSQVIVTASGIKITVDARLEATIRFNPAISLPGEYNFTHYASYEDTLAVADYLLEHFRNLLGMEQPVINVFGGDYNIYDEQRYDIGFYEGI
ncbi:MAG TPA: hypothetical protein GX693_07815, partial [Firmicutes bacterium]|nr:hypothetical protein [Bacillota bacterium]